MKKIERALISVSDKTGIAELAMQLSKRGVEIISTGGTAKLLKGEGVPIKTIDEFTGFPEMLDGRVKTLHPKVHAGLLSMRDNPAHQKTMQEYSLEYIDLVVVNLYPFEATIKKPDVTFPEAIENIDIGGPTMLRSASKNFKDVTVITDPADYNKLLEIMDQNNGQSTFEFNRACAQKVFAATAYYDSLIADFLANAMGPEAPMFGETKTFGYRKVQSLRYGENPHQAAAFYKEAKISEPCATTAKQLHGKELSYNNFIDLDGALELVKEFTEPAAIIVKHTNPCGAATDDDLLTAYLKARETDPDSAFGGILAFNRTVEAPLAEELSKVFVEAVIAPAYTNEAFEIISKKKNIRIMTVEDLPQWLESGRPSSGLMTRKVVGGLLVQERDLQVLGPDGLKCVTKREPTEEEVKSLLFAWKCCKHVKSNAIVYAKGTELVGVGAGQMSRVDSAKIGVMKARKPIQGCVMASDAFFPFRDSVDAAAASGITAIIQPGGSIRDEESIAAADEHGMTMLFTGMRHFKH